MVGNELVEIQDEHNSGHIPTDVEYVDAIKALHNQRLNTPPINYIRSNKVVTLDELFAKSRKNRDREIAYKAAETFEDKMKVLGLLMIKNDDGLYTWSDVNEYDLKDLPSFVSFDEIFANISKMEIDGQISFKYLPVTSLGKVKEIMGNVAFGTEMADLGELKVIDGNAYFGDSQITKLKNLRKITGRADFYKSKVITLGKLEFIGEDAIFTKSKVKSLGKLKRIGGDALFSDSKLVDLGNLESIGGKAFFSDSKLVDLGNLESIGEYANFEGSLLTNLGKLKRIGGGVTFANSKLVDLGNLESIGKTVDFRDSLITNLGKLQRIGGDALFFDTKLVDLGNLESIDGNASFRDSLITNLGKLKFIGGNAIFTKSKVVDLGNLESIGGQADFRDSRVTNLGKLDLIGGNAIFTKSKLVDLGNLEIVGGNADFQDSLVTNLGKLKRIDKTAFFSNSKLVDLGNLESIGGDADFRYSLVTNLGKLKRIDRDALFFNSKLVDLGNLEIIGGYAIFNNSKLVDLGNLEIVGGNADFQDSLVTNLGKLKRIEGNAFFSNSKLVDLGNLESIGGTANFVKSKIISLGNLKHIGGNLAFDDKLRSFGKLEIVDGQVDYFFFERNGQYIVSPMTDTGKLRKVGTLSLSHSNVTSLGSIEEIGFLNLNQSKVTDLGKLKYLREGYRYSGSDTKMRRKLEKLLTRAKDQNYGLSPQHQQGNQQTEKLQTSGFLKGFTINDIVYFSENAENVDFNTPIHEYGHLWVNHIEKKHPDLYQKGISLAKESPLFQEIKNSPDYANIANNDERVAKEVLAQMIGDNGESIINSTKDKDFISRVKDFLSELWTTIKADLGIRNLNIDEIRELTLERFTKMATADILFGGDIGSYDTNVEYLNDEGTREDFGISDDDVEFENDYVITFDSHQLETEDNPDNKEYEEELKYAFDKNTQYEKTMPKLEEVKQEVDKIEAERDEYAEKQNDLRPNTAAGKRYYDYVNAVFAPTRNKQILKKRQKEADRLEDAMRKTYPSSPEVKELYEKYRKHYWELRDKLEQARKEIARWNSQIANQIWMSKRGELSISYRQLKFLRMEAERGGKIREELEYAYNHLKVAFRQPPARIQSQEEIEQEKEYRNKMAKKNRDEKRKQAVSIEAVLPVVDEMSIDEVETEVAGIVKNLDGARVTIKNGRLGNVKFASENTEGFIENKKLRETLIQITKQTTEEQPSVGENRIFRALVEFRRSEHISNGLGTTRYMSTIGVNLFTKNVDGKTYIEKAYVIPTPEYYRRKEGLIDNQTAIDFRITKDKSTTFDDEITSLKAKKPYQAKNKDTALEMLGRRFLKLMEKWAANDNNAQNQDIARNILSVTGGDVKKFMTMVKDYQRNGEVRNKQIGEAIEKYRAYAIIYNGFLTSSKADKYVGEGWKEAIDELIGEGEAKEGFSDSEKSDIKTALGGGTKMKMRTGEKVISLLKRSFRGEEVDLAAELGLEHIDDITINELLKVAQDAKGLTDQEIRDTEQTIKDLVAGRTISPAMQQLIDNALKDVYKKQKKQLTREETVYELQKVLEGLEAAENEKIGRQGKLEAPQKDFSVLFLNKVLTLLGKDSVQNAGKMINTLYGAIVNQRHLGDNQKAMFLRRLENVDLTKDDFIPRIKEILNDIERTINKNYNAYMREKIGNIAGLSYFYYQNGIKKGRYAPEDEYFFQELNRIMKMYPQELEAELASEEEKIANRNLDENPLDEKEQVRLGVLRVMSGEMLDNNYLAFVYQRLLTVRRVAYDGKMQLDIALNEQLEAEKQKIVSHVEKGIGGLRAFFSKKFGDLSLLIKGIAGQEASASWKPIIVKYMKAKANANDRIGVLQSILMKLYGVNDISKFSSMWNTYSTETVISLDHQLYKGNKKDGTPTKQYLTRANLIYIWTQLQNPRQKTRYEMQYGKDIEKQISEILSDTDKDAALMMIMFLAKDQDELNKAIIDTFGISLRFVENYFPSTGYTENVSPDMQELQQMGSVLNKGWLKERMIFANMKLADPLAVIYNHINETEALKAGGQELHTLLRAWRSSLVKEKIEGMRIGKKVDMKKNVGYYKVIEEELKMFVEQVNGKYIYDSQRNPSIWDKLINNLIVAKIALKPIAFLKQAATFVAFMADDVKSGSFMANFAEGVLINPKKTWQYMMKNPVLRQRFKNTTMNEAFAQLDGSRGKTWQRKLQEAALIFVTGGDAASFVYGGYAFIKQRMKEGKTEVEAFDELIFRVEQTQQSTNVAFRRTWETKMKKHWATRLMLAFTSAQNQAMAKIVDTFVNLADGKISGVQAAKNVAIFGVLQGALYQFLCGYGAFLFADDDDDEKMGALKIFGFGVIENLTGGIPMVNMLVNIASVSAINKVFNTKFRTNNDTYSSVLQMFYDEAKRINKADGITDIEAFIAAGNLITNSAIGIELRTLITRGEGAAKVTGIMESDTSYFEGIFELIGYSQYFSKKMAKALKRGEYD
jgi:hypothetical protein